MIDYAPRTDIELTYDQAFLHTITCTHNNYKDWRLLTIQEYSNPFMPVNTWHDSVPYYRYGNNYTRYAMPVRTQCY